MVNRHEQLGRGSPGEVVLGCGVERLNRVELKLHVSPVCSGPEFQTWVLGFDWSAGIERARSLERGRVQGAACWLAGRLPRDLDSSKGE